jgi:hypothetical protein
VVIAYVQSVKVSQRVTLNIDAHLVETDKAGAQPCYEGFKSFQPIEVCWAETGLVLTVGLRPDDSLYESCIRDAIAPEVRNIGDSFSLGRVFEATKAGYAIGRAL